MNFEEWKKCTPIKCHKPSTLSGWYRPEDYPTSENFERHIRGYNMYYWISDCWVKKDDKWFEGENTGTCPYDPKCYVCHKVEAESYFWHCSDIPTDKTLTQYKEHYEEKYADGLECIDCFTKRVIPLNKL